MKWLALLVLVGCDPAGEATRAQGVVNGTLDRGDLPVVAITARRIRCEDSAVPRCTGIVIAPDVVLTSAVCAQQARGALEVFVGTPVGDHAGTFIDVVDVAVDPRFDPQTHAFDLALLRLAERAPVVPAPLPAVTVTEAADGQNARIVGYGVTQQSMTSDGTKREGRMTVASVEAYTVYAASRPGTPAYACGDDGGPLFVTLPPNGEQLIGVIASDDARCEEVTVAARIDVALADFITPYLASAAPGAGTIELADVCGAECAADADCPAAMACLDGRCRVAGDIAGNYTSACATDDQCGASTCARVAPDDCRCHVSCAQLEQHLASCDAGGGGAGLLVGLAALGATRRRRARGPRGRCASSTACRGR